MPKHNPNPRPMCDRRFDKAVLGEIEARVSSVQAGVDAIRKGRLNEKALLLLISHASGQSQTVVKSVLDGMASLEKTFFKKPGQP